MQWPVALGTELNMVELPETGGERTFGPVGSITEFDPEATFRRRRGSRRLVVGRMISSKEHRVDVS
jgi:hypothetical protein